MEEKINWKRKLTSRKFWVAIVGLVTGIMVFCGRPESEAAQVGALILQAASVVAYIIGEGLADAANANAIIVPGVIDNPGDDAE